MRISTESISLRFSRLQCDRFFQCGRHGWNGRIEQFYNEDLMGVNGREYGYLDEENNLEGVLKEPTNGKTVVSTIDLNIQNILQKYIDEWQTTVGSHVTAAIAMNPKTERSWEWQPAINLI